MKTIIQQLKSNRYQEGLTQQNFLQLFVLSYTLRTICKHSLTVANDVNMRHATKTTIPLFSRKVWFFWTLSISDLQNKTEAFSIFHLYKKISTKRNLHIFWSNKDSQVIFSPKEMLGKNDQEMRTFARNFIGYDTWKTVWRK